MNSKIDIKLKVKKIEGWTIHGMIFENDKSPIIAIIRGKLANIQTKPGKKKRLEWQQQISNEIKKQRGDLPRKKTSNYLISIGMRFPYSKTQKQSHDIDNFIKPIFAGIACGLFVEGEIPDNLEKFKDYDDSHFNHLYVERLTPKEDEEGVLIIISESL